MSNFRQSLRPKHQVLVLKCYPRYQKNAQDVGPNSSELSYLLYYASTRRSKLPKVSAFLERKAAHEVRKKSLTNVQVTLQIVTALIEKCPRDLPLYASNVIRILQQVLQSRDINFIEESIFTFSALSAHYDKATLAADYELSTQYDGLVQTYAAYASKWSHNRTKGRPKSVPEALRFRSAGLRAIKSLVTPDTFGGGDNGRRIKIIVPAILENIYSTNPTYLSLLQRRESQNDHFEKSHRMRERQSFSVQRANELKDLDGNRDPTTAAGTTADVDKRAEEDVGVLAMQCLRLLFSATNRGHVRVSTSGMLEFIFKYAGWDPSSAGDQAPAKRYHRNWATELFAAVCIWTPVQDRFVVLVTVMETLIRSPIVEEDLTNQLSLSNIIGTLLQSNINFIGLSVMDVLIGLMQHILLLLQLGGSESKLSPHHQQSIGGSSATIINPEAMQSSSADTLTDKVVMEVVEHPSELRILLLEQLRACIGDLATHVYYSDQIKDMIKALLQRLKPSPQSAVPTPVNAIADPQGAAEAIATSGNLHEKSDTDGYFSFDTARVLALHAVKDILVIANSNRKHGEDTVGRKRVKISVWEGTQWLLRDTDGRVRKAYVDALLTWLNLELNRKDLRLIEEHVQARKSSTIDSKYGAGSVLARQAISAATQKTRNQNRAHTSFLQLLHLAVYENAHTYADCEPDTLILHLLLSTLVEKLGVNSTRSGLPMIFRLQSDIESLQDPLAKLSISGIVHGYLWALSESFEFENSPIGRQIHGEISRRSSRGLWLKSIRMPPIPVELILTPGENPVLPLTAEYNIQPGELKPFTARQQLVDVIADSYQHSIVSPPGSPASSPSKIPLKSPPPILHMNSYLGTNIPLASTLPEKVNEEMLADWTREICMADVERDNKSSSLSGSKHSGSIKGANGNGIWHTDEPDATEVKPQGSSPGPRRYLSGASSRHGPSTSSLRSVVRVADLKRILVEGQPAAMAILTRRRDNSLDTGTDSMMSISERSSSASLHSHTGSGANGGSSIGTGAATPYFDAASTHQDQAIKAELTPPQRPADEDIPPVPQLPPNLKQFTAPSSVQGAMLSPNQAADIPQTEPLSLQKQVGHGRDRFKFPDGRWNLMAIVDSIDASAPSRPSISGMTGPPY